MSESWKETSAWDAESLTDRFRRIQLVDLQQHMEQVPVHSAVVPAIDPDEVERVFDTAEMVTLGEMVNVDTYPVGTWFYWGEGYVWVGDGTRLFRKEKRQCIG